MFTGLIESVGNLRSLTPLSDDGGLRIVVNVPKPPSDIKLGDSVAVNGCCLTLVERQGDDMSFDVSSESIAKTNLGELRANEPVNIEYAMRLGDRLGGHLVSGHIDGVGEIESFDDAAGCKALAVVFPKALGRYAVKKGSICIDGVSLTLNDIVDTGEFCRVEIVLIPATIAKTRFQSARPGQRVNLEMDMMAKYVERLRG